LLELGEEVGDGGRRELERPRQRAGGVDAVAGDEPQHPRAPHVQGPRRGAPRRPPAVAPGAVEGAPGVLLDQACALGCEGGSGHGGAYDITMMSQLQLFSDVHHRPRIACPMGILASAMPTRPAGPSAACLLVLPLACLLAAAAEAAELSAVLFDTEVTQVVREGPGDLSPTELRIVPPA